MLISARNFWHRHAWWLVTLGLSLAFLFLRFYRIESSLLFFNDIGRDFLELWDWEHSGKPPLLGPQTSALPFNQSAGYFYLLMPFYVLANHSLLSTLIACAVVQLGLLWGGVLWLRRHQPRWLNWFWLLTGLLLLQPQLIIQQRFVWNPSFLVGWLGLALVASWQLVTTSPAKWQRNWGWIWGLGLSLAVSFSYSAVPALLAAASMSVIWWGWSARKLWLPVAAGLVLWNLPTVVFELKYKFLLTHMLIFGPWIKQIPSTLTSRWTDLSGFLVGSTAWFGGSAVWLVSITFGLWLLITGICLGYHLKNRQLHQSWSPLFVWTASWWLLTVVVTLCLPVAVQSHYIFPVLLLGVASLVLLPHWSKWLIIGVLVLNWLQPLIGGDYWRPARQTLSELEACSQLVCETIKAPVFVSNQAGAHPYHNAMEYQYLLRRAGCNLKDIANHPDQAQTMVVMLDDSVYEHGKTAYNELTLFGPSQVFQRLQCSSKLEAIILNRR